jgi:hypothetical protein
VAASDSVMTPVQLEIAPALLESAAATEVTTGD